MNWWDKNWGFVVFPLLIVGVIWLLIEAGDNDAKTRVFVAGLPEMQEEGRVSTSPHTALWLRGFDWRNKRCLWATDGRQAGLTCWNKE